METDISLGSTSSGSRPMLANIRPWDKPTASGTKQAAVPVCALAPRILLYINNYLCMKPAKLCNGTLVFLGFPWIDDGIVFKLTVPLIYFTLAVCIQFAIHYDNVIHTIQRKVGLQTFYWSFIRDNDGITRCHHSLWLERPRRASRPRRRQPPRIVPTRNSTRRHKMTPKQLQIPRSW